MWKWFTLSSLISLSLVHAELPKGLPWFQGPTEKAFDIAKKMKQPLFIYWGAVWCPPCNQIKKNLLPSPRFAKALSGVIAVYIDGDQKDAQRWSDKLGAKGYPTLMLLSSEGKELARIPTGLTPDESARIVEAALQSSQAKESWAILAGEYDENQDYAQLYSTIPATRKKEKSRLFFHLLHQLKDSQQTAPTALREDLIRILESPELSQINLESLAYQSRDWIELLTLEKTPEREKLITLYLDRMTIFEKEKNLTLDEQTSLLAPAIELYELQHPLPFSKELIDRVLARVAQTDREAKDPLTRQAAMSTSIDLLISIHDYAGARRYAEAEIKQSHSPYYFMRLLAQIEKEDKNPERSLSWSAKAYEASKGHATRFEWGTAYILALLELAPDDGTRIKSTTLKVMAEMLKEGDAFTGRLTTRLDRLQKKIGEWNTTPAHHAILADLQKDLEKACNTRPGHSDCLDWVKTLGTAPKSEPAR